MLTVGSDLHLVAKSMNRSTEKSSFVTMRVSNVSGETTKAPKADPLRIRFI